MDEGGSNNLDISLRGGGLLFVVVNRKGVKKNRSVSKFDHPPTEV